VWRVTLKELLAHRFRLALTALAIMLGVGFVAGTFMFTDTIDLSFDELFAQATSDIDVVVRADTAFIASGPGTTGETQRIPESLLPKVRGVEGVADAQGFVQGYAQLVDEHGEAVAPQGPPTLGVSWIPGELSALSLREGRRPEHDGEVAIDARTAKEHGFEVGERATVLSLGPPEEFEVVGIAGFGSADNLGGSTLAIFETETAQRVLDAEGEFDSITVGAVEGVAPPKLRERIAAIVPKDVEVATATRVAQEQAGAVKEALGFLNTALLVFAGVALFVGAFIIYNTFNILVTQRSRELALLRTLGASARQVTAVVVGEALLVGVLASGIGIGAGALMSYGLRALLDAFGDAAQLLIAEREGSAISASLVLAWAGHGVYLAAGSNAAGLEHRAAHVLQWHAIGWAKERGARTWDQFGIADARGRVELGALDGQDRGSPDMERLEAAARRDPLDGVYRFKKGWGGQVVRFMPAYDRVFFRPAYWLWRRRRSDA